MLEKSFLSPVRSLSQPQFHAYFPFFHTKVTHPLLVSVACDTHISATKYKTIRGNSLLFFHKTCKGTYVCARRSQMGRGGPLPWGICGNVWRCLCLLQLGGGSAAAEPGDTAKYSTMYRTAPTTIIQPQVSAVPG